MGPVNELVEVRWRFRPYSNAEILTKSRGLENGQIHMEGKNPNLDALVYLCAMGISGYSDLNNEHSELFELFRAKNFTEVFRIEQDMITEIIHHNMSNRTLNEQTLDAMFHFGSVLCASRTIKILFGKISPFEHAAVYLGKGEVVHVSVDPLKEVGTEASIFKIEPFSKFLKESTEVKEYRWRYSPFSPEQIWSKARSMTSKKYKYNLRDQNCEHLAFQCAMAIDLSPQMENPLKRIGANAFGSFFASGSASRTVSNQASSKQL